MLGMDGIGTSICGAGSSPADMDPFMLPAFDGLDGYTELGTSPMVDESILSAICLSPNSEEQAEPDATMSDGDSSPGGLVCGEAMRISTATIPKTIHGGVITLPERMLRALATLKEASGGLGAILAQVWVPVRNGDHQVLTTSDQPFLLDQRLTGYREVSRQFTFAAAEGPGQFPGLPGRVFMSGMPEWTSNVMYYNGSEYLRVDYAARHEVRGSLAVPVFDFSGRSDSCCAVLEVVMTEEKENFCSEIHDISNALQSVHLSTVKAWTYPKKLTSNQESAFKEILDVLRSVCHAHMLPLALVWVPFWSSSNGNLSVEYGNQDIMFGLRKKDLLWIKESASYVNDMRMHGFVRACAEHPLKRGQGVAGNAILSNNPFFSSDVRYYDMRDYPLVHHARKFGLNAAVAIRLRSTLTGNDDYVLEYFLPPLCKGADGQQCLLDNISETMRRVCKSLRTVSDAELMANETVPFKEKGYGIKCSSPDVSVNSGQKLSVISETETNILSGNQVLNNNEHMQEKKHSNKLKPSTTSQGEKRRTSTEKNVSLSVLQKYFVGSLKDAAKSIGVCPTTLKRICRQHGISRWPSRKIKKVNRSLKKIQNVISSVHGVDGELKYDPATGFLISSISPSEKSLLINIEGECADPINIESEVSQLKFELDCDSYQREYERQCVLKAQGRKLSDNDFNLNEGGLLRSSGFTVTSNRALSADTNNHSNLAKEKDNSFKSGLQIVETQCKKETNTGNHGNNFQQSLPSPSSMTECSSDSASSHGTFRKCSKSQSANEGNKAIIVKANYKDDTVRFRLLPSMKHQDLLEEIAKRLKLSAGAIQLKYKDDEDEWVILGNEADLQECLDILDITRSHILKVQVKHVPSAAGSSSGSSSMLGT